MVVSEQAASPVTSTNPTLAKTLFANPPITKVSDAIGNTPLLELVTTVNGSRLLLKMELFNPTGSAKIRMAKSMLDHAEQKGVLSPGDWIVESTSGNTGVGLAMLAAERGYRFTAIVDHHAAKDKIVSMMAFGAEIIYVNEQGSDRLATAARDAMAEQLSIERGAYWTAQHNNPSNSDGYIPLAQELIADLGENLTHLVGAVGTGGSLCGTATVLRDYNINPLTIIGVEPLGSIIFGGPAMAYLQSGTGTPEGADIGSLIDYALIDNGIKVSDKHAFNTARYLARHHAVMVGGSAGGVIYAALQQLKQAPNGSTVVALVCDGGEKYLDTVFNDAWMQHYQLHDKDIEQELATGIIDLQGHNLATQGGHRHE